MGDWLLWAVWLCAGYSVAAAALGLGGESAGWRVAWGAVLGAAGVLILMPVVLVLVLSGGLPRLGSISVSVWAFVAGVLGAGVAGACRAWGGEWIKARPGAVAGAGFAVAVLIAGVLALGWIGNGARAGAGGKVASGEPVRVAGERSPGANGAAAGEALAVSKAGQEVVQAQSAPAVESCDCAQGALCTGPRGGRYCLRPDGAKKYQP